MGYSKEELETVVEEIVGSNLRNCLGLPRAVERAAVLIFLDLSPSQYQSQVIRKALLDLQEVGHFKFKEVGDNNE